MAGAMFRALVIVAALAAPAACTVPEVEPTVAPASVGGVVPDSARTPDSTSTPEPSPTTTQGPYGDTLRLVPSDPTATFECRPPTAAELAVLRREDANQDGRVVVVDVAEGWSVVAYSYTYKAGDGATYREPNQGITDGGTSFQNVPAAGWPGPHTTRGFALADGPKALEAARQCLA